MRKAGRKLNNAGAALVTVIVVIAFISVMVTVLLYSTSVNFYMKTTDMRIKGSFYDAETTLEEIRAALVKRVGDAYEIAYMETQKNYASIGSGSAREEAYKKAFVEAFEDSWRNDVISYGGNTLYYIKTMVDSGHEGDLVPVPAPGGGELTPVLEVDKAEGRIVLRNLRVSHLSGDYVSIIETDFIIRAPEISWSVTASATAWAAGDGASALERKEIDMVNSVNYLNWTKK